MIPKYRAWWKSEKKMITEISWIRFNERDFIGKVNNQTILPISFDDAILMHFIGLFDKKGDEIYEGDIVLLHHFTLEYAEGGGAFEGENEIKGVIKLKRPLEDIVGKAYPPEWVLFTGHEYLSINLIEGIHEESFEVLGNQWENPDLVEVRG